MKIIDLISNKKLGKSHSKDEIDFIINSMIDGTIPDYQISAWLMAVCFNGMTAEETAFLTDAIVQSGNIVDFGELKSQMIDKNSTGGVGDKVSIILVPLLAAMGIPMVKLSDQSIGYTGGTADKLESIPGLRTELTIDEMISQAKKINAVIASQTNSLTPACVKLHKLRNATGTIDCIPLLASSVIAKKIAAGADNIILDVKYGSGAYMKTKEDAEKIANIIVEVGKKLNKPITTIITSMEEPLGRTIGNSLEVIEAIEFLKGKIPEGDLADLTYAFGAYALVQIGEFSSIEDAKAHLKTILESGKAIDKFRELIIQQKGNDAVIDNYDTFALPQYKISFSALRSGFVNKIDAYKIACACKVLGAIREHQPDNEIDRSVGIYLNKKTGEYLDAGDIMFTIYSNDEQQTEIAKNYCYEAFEISDNKPEKTDLVYKVIRNTDNVQ